jgi:tetratricopeptide (TPR) repeat protein
MSDIGYNDNIDVAGRKFHIQTASNINKGNAQCDVFEEGRVITSHIVNFERRKIDNEQSLEQRLRKIVAILHKETTSEIELMFLIGEKVKKLRHAPSNIKLGLIFLRNNLIKDAIEQFEIAISIDPDSIEALNNLALSYINLGKNEKAIQLLNMALEKGNPYADIYHNLGLAYLNQKQHYKALNNFQEALRINPHYIKTHYNMGILYLESILVDKSDTLLPPPSIRMERAQQQFKKLEKLKIKSFSKINSKIQKALKNNEIKKAVQILINNRDTVFPEQVLSLIGMDFYLKFMYGGKGLDGDIIKKFEQKLYGATVEHPEYADLWNNLGIVHLIQCRNLFLQALNEFDKALEINPSFEKALKNKKLVENDGKEFLILLRAILR